MSLSFPVRVWVSLGVSGCVCVCLCVSVCVWLSVTALSLSFPVSATLLNSVAQLSKVENVLKQQEELN